MSTTVVDTDHFTFTIKLNLNTGMIKRSQRSGIESMQEWQKNTILNLLIKKDSKEFKLKKFVLNCNIKENCSKSKLIKKEKPDWLKRNWKEKFLLTIESPLKEKFRFKSMPKNFMQLKWNIKELSWRELLPTEPK